MEKRTQREKTSVHTPGESDRRGRVKMAMREVRSGWEWAWFVLKGTRAQE